MKFISAAILSLLLISPTLANAQQVAQFATQVSTACLGNWQTQDCMAAVSQSSLSLISNYAETLQQAGQATSVESLKNHCAATTAAAQQQVPAYAMKSALTECANTMTGIAAQTGVQPDPSHYQLLIAPVLCMGEDPRCEAVEAGLKRFSVK